MGVDKDGMKGECVPENAATLGGKTSGLQLHGIMHLISGQFLHGVFFEKISSLSLFHSINSFKVWG